MKAQPNTNIRDVFNDLGFEWKTSLTVLAAANVFVNMGFKYLVVRLSLKCGGLWKNPLNIMILIDEFERLVGVMSLTSECFAANFLGCVFSLVNTFNFYANKLWISTYTFSAWMWMLIWDIKPLEIFGELPCTILTVGAQVGFVINFLGGCAIAVVRMIYLKVRHVSLLITYFEKYHC